MQQYLRIKEQHRDAVLFFRLGDFYEMFRGDAQEVSSLLNLTLTQRHGVPMCGIPYHAAQNYIGRLLKAGKKIAICEQTVLPGKGQKLAEREVVEVITPGTVVDDTFLQERCNNYIAAVCEAGSSFSFSCADLSTGEFLTTSFPVKEREKLRREIYRMAPREILVPESLAEQDEFGYLFDGLFFVNRFPDWYFDAEGAYKRLIGHFKTTNLKSFGLEAKDPEVVTAGALVEYVSENSRSQVPHLLGIKKYSDCDFLGMDEATQKNLELVRNLQEGTTTHTLLEVLDYTKTAAGSRRLRQWILHPLVKKDEIETRLDRVDFCYRNQRFLSGVREILGSVLDLERLATRLALDRTHPRDMVSLGKTLFLASELEVFCRGENAPFFVGAETLFEDFRRLASEIQAVINEEPPLNIVDGGVIRSGYDPEIDHYRELQTERERILSDYLDLVRSETGLGGLKLKYNRIIGYFFEIPKSQAAQIPEGFIRRQSLVGGERYSTERLGELETEINSASEKLLQREREVFASVVKSLKPLVPLILEGAALVSEIDVAQSFAFAATRNGYVRPVLTEDRDFHLEESRHPVVEKHLPSGTFVPNPISISAEQKPVMLVTGPNMAGKSTLLRQAALITVMAQTGSFVPAASACIGLVDRIFCRVGASDNLARGESTFLVEMNETAYILRNATGRSLVIMDEVGRGTGTDDGLAIAWSVLEYLIHVLGCRSFFATHYHELTRIDDSRIRNMSMAVRDQGKEIVFLRKIVEGAASSSYGLHVAELAGIPAPVISRAKEIHRMIKSGKGGIEAESYEIPKANFEQRDLFSPIEPLIEELRRLDINRMTPLNALEKIVQWQKILDKETN